MYVLFQAQAHTMEDSSKEKAGVLKHALGFHSHPEKRECSHQRAEVVKGDLALLELTKTCKIYTSWPELPVSITRTAPPLTGPS